MLKIITFLAGALLLAGAAAAQPQEDAPAPASAPTRAVRPAGPTGPIRTDRYHASFIQLGTPSADALLYEPNTIGPKARIALVFTFPRATFGATPAFELASRGYRVLWVTPYSEDESPFDGIDETSRGVTYMRSLPGVERVVVMSHSGGGRMMAFYAALAEKGPAVCQRPELLYPCETRQATGIAKPDGLVLLDPAHGALNTASAIDPAYAGDARTRADLDMYSASNGFDPATGSAHYSPEFARRFFAAQSARNMRIVNAAVARLKLIDAGKGDYTRDEPFVVPGAVNGGNAASLYHTDPAEFLSHTKRPHILLKADGTQPEVIVHTVRAPTGLPNVRNLNALCCSSLNYTVRDFLANDAIRTTPDYRITEDDVIGVDWHSAMRSTPASAESITVPTLMVMMSCFHLMVTGEITYDHLAARDKTFAVVEGALHEFKPCKPEYGDTQKRTFDFVDAWLAKPGRF